MGSSGSNQQDHVADEFGSLDFVETVACLRGGFDARINLLRAGAVSLGLDVMNHFFLVALLVRSASFLEFSKPIAISSPVRSNEGFSSLHPRPVRRD